MTHTHTHKQTFRSLPARAIRFHISFATSPTLSRLFMILWQLPDRFSSRLFPTRFLWSLNLRTAHVVVVRFPHCCSPYYLHCALQLYQQQAKWKHAATNTIYTRTSFLSRFIFGRLFVVVRSLISTALNLYTGFFRFHFFRLLMPFFVRHS